MRITGRSYMFPQKTNECGSTAVSRTHTHISVRHSDSFFFYKITIIQNTEINDSEVMSAKLAITVTVSRTKC